MAHSFSGMNSYYSSHRSMQLPVRSAAMADADFARCMLHACVVLLRVCVCVWCMLHVECCTCCSRKLSVRSLGIV